MNTATMRSSHRRLHISKHQHQVSEPEELQEEEEEEEEEYSDDMGKQHYEASSSSYSIQQSNDVNSTTNNGDDDDRVGRNSSVVYSSSASASESTYINVAPLPIFHGLPSECPITHLSRFRRACAANNALSTSTVLRIFPVTLDSHASLWYDLAVEPYDLSWPHIQSLFLQTFLRPDAIDRARFDLLSLNQSDEESITVYHLRMQWILKKWPYHNLPDSFLKDIFIDGLREDFRAWVVPLKPETLEAAVKLAGDWEKVAATRRRQTAAIKKKCGFCYGGDHEEGGCEARITMKELWLKSKGGGEEEKAGKFASRKGDEGRLGRAVSFGGMRGQCQCWKHQCWKKFERSASVVSDKIVSDKNAAASPAAGAADQA